MFLIFKILNKIIVKKVMLSKAINFILTIIFLPFFLYTLVKQKKAREKVRNSISYFIKRILTQFISRNNNNLKKLPFIALK